MFHTMPKRDRPSSDGDDDNNNGINKIKEDKKQLTAEVKKAPSGTRGLTELDDIFAVKKKAQKAFAEEEKKQVKAAAKASAATSHSKSKPSLKGTQSRQDVEGLSPNVWYDDGLGGKFNRDGFTGRVEGGVKVFKAHLFNKKEFGQSKDCPFDCNCCFI